MAPLTASLKRAPKWAWYTAAGVGVGAAVIKVYKDRDADPSDPEVGEVVGTAAAPVLAGSPTPTIVPPVIIGGNAADPNAGVPVLQELYIGAVSDLVHGWEALVGPLTSTVTTIAMEASPNALQALAMAGGPPGLAQDNPTPVMTAPAPAPAVAAPVPTPKPPATFTKITKRQTFGRKADKNLWCGEAPFHRWSDGRPDVQMGPWKVVKRGEAC